jgi:hypothetical protein
MASPGELVNVLASMLGVPEVTVTQHDRNLVAAGLRTKGGRGRSAAKVTPRDAAHLLIAVMGSELIKDSTIAVRRYQETRVHNRQPKEDGWADFALPELAALPRDHSFVDALTALISAAAAGSLEQLFERDGHVEANGRRATQIINPVRIEVSTPDPHGMIQIFGLRDDLSRGVPYLLPGQFATTARQRERHHALLNSLGVIVGHELRQWREVGANTVFSLGKLLRGSVDGERK